MLCVVCVVVCGCWCWCAVCVCCACVCVVCGAAWNTEEKKLYVHNAYVCNGKTPACSTHAGVLRVHTETLLSPLLSLLSLPVSSCLSPSLLLPVSLALALALPFSLSLVRLRSFAYLHQHLQYTICISVYILPSREERHRQQIFPCTRRCR